MKDVNILKEENIKNIEYINDGAFDFRTKIERNTNPHMREVIPTNSKALDKNLKEDPHQKGVKLDSYKVDLDLVLGDFARALVEVGKVGTEGAKKYTPHGWLEVPNGIRRYRSGMLRHHFQESEGELIDPDFGLMHSAHRAWNALAVLELQLREIEKK